MRFGGTLSGPTGSSGEVTPVYYPGASQPGGPGNKPILAEIRVWDTFIPCLPFWAKSTDPAM